MNHLRIAISLLIAVFAGMVSGPDSWAEESNNTEARIARVEAGLLPSLIRTDLASPMWTLAERMQHYQAPAVSLAVLDDFEIVWARAWGVTKLGSDARATPETLFQFGSISKPVAALLTLRMVSEERLGLNDPVNELLTSWKLPDSAAGGTEPVLLRHVLSHGAGIAPFTLHMYEPGEEYPGVLALLKNKAESPIPPVVRVRPPGERFEYANAGYAVMEQLLEDVSGEDLVKLAQKTLFDPLEMKSTSFARKLPVALYEQAAWGHTGEDQAPIDGKGLYPPAAVGGLWSTPTDLGRLLQELMLAYRGDEDRWFPTELAREMLSPQIQGQGLGVRLRGEARGRYFLHGGGMPGFVALFVAFPETGQGAVVAINGGAYPLLGEILRAVAAEYDWPGYLPKFEIQEMSAERFARFKGRYVFDRSGGTEMEISSAGGKYFRGRAEMVPVGERTFAVHQLGDVVEFLVDSDGETRTFRYGEHGINQAWARRMPADLPNRARVDAGVARGVVRKFVGPFCNLETNLSEDDLKFLGIERGDVFEVRVGGQQLRAKVVEDFAEVQAGDWAMIPREPGRLVLGRQGANSLSELGVEAGAPIEVRPIRVSGD
ncbi:MAG: serine hydrolase domain-containing protein [Thermoanaerobaculia bacterium]